MEVLMGSMSVKGSKQTGAGQWVSPVANITLPQGSMISLNYSGDNLQVKSNYAYTEATEKKDEALFELVIYDSNNNELGYNIFTTKDVFYHQNNYAGTLESNIALNLPVGSNASLFCKLRCSLSESSWEGSSTPAQTLLKEETVELQLSRSTLTGITTWQTDRLNVQSGEEFNLSIKAENIPATVTEFVVSIKCNNDLLKKITYPAREISAGRSWEHIYNIFDIIDYNNSQDRKAFLIGAHSYFAEIAFSQGPSSSTCNTAGTNLVVNVVQVPLSVTWGQTDVSVTPKINPSEVNAGESYKMSLSIRNIQSNSNETLSLEWKTDVQGTDAILNSTPPNSISRNEQKEWSFDQQYDWSVASESDCNDRTYTYNFQYSYGDRWGNKTDWQIVGSDSQSVTVKVDQGKVDEYEDSQQEYGTWVGGGVGVLGVGLTVAGLCAASTVAAPAAPFVIGGTVVLAVGVVGVGCAGEYFGWW
jgi:hypothetical protein